MDHREPPIPVLATALAASAIGLGELAWHAHSGGPLETGSVWAGAAAVALVYGALGLLSALGARLLARLGLRWLRGPAAALPLATAAPLVAHLLSFLWADWSPTSRRLLQLAMALALASALFLVLRALIARVPRLGDARTLAAANALFLILVVVAPHARSTPGGSRPSARGPSALLITIDTLRADHLGAYGHAGARTPVLDGLAADGLLFEEAMAPCVLTGPSHTSILSGLLPLQHGVIENVQRVPPEVPTVAELLGAEGWDTSAFVSGYPVSNRAAGLLERFGHWDDDMRPRRELPRRAFGVSVARFAALVLDPLGIDLDPKWRKAPLVTDAAAAWMEAGAADRPFFSWVHYYDPHLPYEAPHELVDEAAHELEGLRGEHWYKLDADGRRAVVESGEAVERMGLLYDAEIALVDRELGRLIEAARRRAGPEGLWIVITSDHGESFGEHGVWYRRELYDASLHVPLLVIPPEGADLPRGLRVAQQVRLIDVAPTLLDALGFAGALATEGVSLLQVARGEGESPGPSVATIFTSRADPYQRFLMSVRDGRYKSIWRAAGWLNSDAKWEGETRELYDLEADPDELHNLAEEMPELWEALRTRAGEVELEMRSSESLSTEDLETLRSLGYTL
jgi:arylsulfatase A-like enzyme